MEESTEESWHSLKNAIDAAQVVEESSKVVDFILAFDGGDTNSVNIEKRQVFESKVQGEGLLLDYDTEQNIHFVKIHAPTAVLCRYAEILKFRFPLRSVPGQGLVFDRDSKLMDKCVACVLRTFWKKRFRPPEPRFFYEFSRRHMQLYDLENPHFFDAGLRNNIVHFILERQHFDKHEESPVNMGIDKLLEDKVYLSAYPLHDNEERAKLLTQWASLKRCLSLQPMSAIYRYFGAKVTLYFAWLGFYVFMLVPLSIVGVLCFIYGLATWPIDPISRDICGANRTVLMCPQCDSNCDFWELRSICRSAEFNYLLDNHTTIAFTLMMSVWAVLYLEFWNQYSAGVIHSWGLTGFSQHVEHPRPRYLAKLYQSETLAVQFNAASNSMEPVVPFWRMKFLPAFTSYSILVLFICVSLIAVAALVIYRMAQRASYGVFGSSTSMARKILVLPVTTGLLDLIVISVLNVAYKQLAAVLTDLEYCRTQIEYEESLTIKNYIFQFVNYYTSLFYIAFLKNKFVGYPAKYNRVLGFRQEECNPGGCLIELSLQLVIIMVGKQTLNAGIEMLLPYAKKMLRLLCFVKSKTKVKVNSRNPWTQDYNLEPFTSDSMFEENLEMVMQFGFIVLFGLAFPLAPLLALINNVFELRLDAFKYLKLVQRPVARRTRSIGVWYKIMQLLTGIAVFTNAVIIALSTNLIPKIIYVLETGDETLDGFLDFTLSQFNTKDFEVKPEIEGSRFEHVNRCRYSDFRNPPEHAKPYGRPTHYWYIWIGRLAFIVIYQNVIGFLQAVVAWAIPDVPGKLLRRIKREEFLAREYIIEFERKAAVEGASEA